MEHKAASHWFQYFPGNFVWSQQMMSMIDMTAWGAGSMGEVHQVGQRLKDRQGDNEAWYDEWTAQAKIMESRAVEAEEKNRLLTAGTGTTSMRGSTISTPSASFRRASASSRATGIPCTAWRKAYKRRYPNVERVEVPYEGKRPARVFHEGAGLGPQADGGVLRRPRHLQGDEHALRRNRAREARLQHAGDRRAGTGRGAAAAGTSRAATTTRCPAPRPTSMSPRARRSIPKRVAVAWASAWAATTRRASWPSRSATRLRGLGRALRLPRGLGRRRQQWKRAATKCFVAAFQLPWVLGTPDMDAAMEKIKGYHSPVLRRRSSARSWSSTASTTASSLPHRAATA